MTRVLHNAPLPGKLELTKLLVNGLFAMNLPAQRRRRPNPNRAKRQGSSGRTSSRRPVVGLWILCGLLYAAAGMILTALAEPWVWPVAALGAVVQGVALAGPHALQRFRWLRANLLVLGNLLGGTALAVGLSIALNHMGTDNIDDLTIGRAMAEVTFYSLMAVGLAVLCSLSTATLGDRLLRRYQASKTSLILVIVVLVAMGLGGAIGLLIA